MWQNRGVNVRRTPLEGPLVVEPSVHPDERGAFWERYRRARYAEHGIDADFGQDNASFSRAGVVRGLHFQSPNPQAKLVEAVVGEILDVVVDLRRGSPTFGRWHGERLSADSRRQLWVPVGFAHGFQVLSPEGALVAYKVAGPYDPSAERTLLWDDPDLGIDWPRQSAVLSPKDRAGTRLRDLPDEAFF